MHYVTDETWERWARIEEVARHLDDYADVLDRRTPPPPKPLTRPTR